jgi:hypothetical protein
MKKNSHKLAIIALVVVLMSASSVFAGGPLVIFDPATQQPYFYPVPLDVYTDNDPFFSLSGPVPNADADARVAQGIGEWTNVPTASFVGSVAGDFASIGLPDINLSNWGMVIGTDNGGGYHIIYDHNGSLTAALAGPGVLGFSGPEWAVSVTSPHLWESYAVLNGATVSPGDTQALAWQGVFTHEFGHGINLAHTQTNGAVGFFLDDRGPAGCTLPYGGFPAIADLETMYPFLDPRPGGTGVEQGTVDLLDDVSALSDVYPATGWPNNFGSVRGTIFQSDGVTPVTGVNVIIRNLGDPWGDCSSMLSGAFTQGDAGPDGRFQFHGLTPGAQYVVYVDEIVAGGFSTPPIHPLPGPEEFWNGADESGDTDTDQICDWVAITPVAGVPVNADIVFNFGIFLGDDDFLEVALPFTFEFCERDWNSVFIGSNGYLTFGEGATGWSESVTGFLAGPPRIAPLWDDLNPTQGGTITAKEVAGNFVVTYTNIPEFFDFGDNTFSVTLRPDGTFNVDYGDLTAPDGLAGRTEGGGVPDPGETDLSAAPQPLGVGEGTVYEWFNLFDNDLALLNLEYGICDPFEFVFDDALAGVCYASTGASFPNGALLTIDPATGAGSLIGISGQFRLPGLAINSARQIYASSGGGVSQLVRISASNAVSQVVGTIRNASTGSSLAFVDAIAFDGNDVLFGIDSNNILWTIDVSNGLATQVGFTGVIAAPFLTGMAFDPTTGRLYASTGWQHRSWRWRDTRHQVHEQRKHVRIQECRRRCFQPDLDR